jgi:hypothetical protein
MKKALATLEHSHHELLILNDVIELLLELLADATEKTHQQFHALLQILQLQLSRCLTILAQSNDPMTATK